tara:strand:+ start:844 stop:945 length:102 start_codon:yes stop_codon:yes gene_type:complete
MKMINENSDRQKRKQRRKEVKGDEEVLKGRVVY